MSGQLTGGCLCKEVRYQYQGELKEAAYCHCPDCRRTTGSAFCVGVGVEAKNLEIISGIVKAYTKTADSGNKITREFCPKCGSPLFTKVDAFPHTVWIKAGSLDEPELIKPTHQTWTGKAVKWAYIDDDLPSFPQAGPNVEK
ncbi:MAG: GFA family protein [Planctomycetota bacterium]|jgi:hypothetical protein